MSSRSLEANTSTSTRFDCKAPELHTSTSPRLHACGPSPYLHTSSSLHLQHASTFARLQRTSRPLLRQRPRARSMLHKLQTSTPPRLHACSRPPELPSFIPLRHHVCTLAARLPTSIPPYLYTYSLRSSGAPYLYVATPAARP